MTEVYKIINGVWKVDTCTKGALKEPTRIGSGKAKGNTSLLN